jgi:hypothetical protein
MELTGWSWFVTPVGIVRGQYCGAGSLVEFLLHRVVETAGVSQGFGLQFGHEVGTGDVCLGFKGNSNVRLGPVRAFAAGPS